MDHGRHPSRPATRCLLAGAFALLLCLGWSTRAAAQNDPWFGRDKALHFGATFTLAVGGYAGAALVSPSQAVRAASGTTLAMGVGIAKEIYDRYAGGDPSWRDLTWDAVGTATGVVTAWLFDRYVVTPIVCRACR
jgi:putative lipoprotein